MKKITSLLMLFCMVVGTAWGQILTTSPTAGKSYTLKCKATDHVGFIGDNGTIVHGRSEAPTSFVFEAAEGVENGFYIKSEVSGKYLYAEGDANSNVVLSSDNKTIWVVNAPDHSAGYVSLAAHGKTNLYLNNNGDTGTNMLKLNSHGGGPGSGNTCSLWQLCTPSIKVGAGKYYRIINKANANKTITDQESNVLTTKDKNDNDYQQIWYVQGDNYQGYTLKSIFSNRYFNYVDALYSLWGTAENAVKFYIGKAEAATTETPDYFYLTYNTSALPETEAATTETPDYFYLTYNTSALPETEAYAHYSNGNIVRWRWADKSGENYTNVNASLWKFEEVDASVVNTILDGQYSALTNFISGQITKANEIFTTAGFSFDPFALTTENTTCPAEYNALTGGSDGGGVAALLDDNNDTFMHTDYSSKYFEPHYIQVDLGEGTTSKYITFSYRARHNNHNNNPETMIIKGSVDGTTYEDITTLTNLPDGLIEYESNAIGNGKAYRYFRFVVTATTNNDSRNGHVFFSLGKFRLNLVDVNETYAPKVSVLVNLKKAISGFELPAVRPADWCPMTSKAIFNEIQEWIYGVTIREYPFTLTTDVNNPVCYQILSGRGNANTSYYFTLKPNDGGKVKLETNTNNNVYAYWFFMEDPATGKLMIVPFMEENKPLGYVTVADGDSKLTNVHSTENFAGYYYEVIEYGGVNGFPYAIKPYKASTNVSNHGGTGNFMGFYDGTADGGTAVKFEAVTTPALSYRQLPAAIATANSKCPGEDRIGNSVNRYSSASVDEYKKVVSNSANLLNSVSGTTEAAVKEQIQTLNNLYDVLEIFQPENGKFYRFRCCVSPGMPYLQCTQNTQSDRFDMISGSNGAGTTINATFCYYNGGLLAYAKPLYINHDSNKANYKSTVTNVYFRKANTGDLGQYNIIIGGRALYGRDDRTDSGGETPNTDVRYRWWLEEVETIPVTVTAAKYATFYAPCNVTLPEGLTAYYVSETTDKYASLEEVGNVIPANTGVLLYADVTEATTYNLTIGGEASEVESKLKGTVASAYFTTPAYALGLVDNEVGFYTAKMTDGQWLNNGFKAYLPKPANAQGALRFNFGGETTAIESVLNGVDANAPIYDLSGRRVVNAVKGGIYIQNGKKFIVK